MYLSPLRIARRVPGLEGIFAGDAADPPHRLTTSMNVWIEP